MCVITRLRPSRCAGGRRAAVTCQLRRVVLWLGPGVDGAVGVHVVYVELGHLAQRLRSGQTAALQGGDSGGLPGGAGLAGQASLLDDGEQAVDVGLVNTPARESGTGERQ